MIASIQAAILQARANFEAMLQLAPMALITFADSGATLELRAFNRRLQDSELTGGLVQEDTALLISLHAFEATMPARALRRGDTIAIDGHTYAINSVVKQPAIEPSFALELRCRG